MRLFSAKYPRFSDGELDLWPAHRVILPDKAAINSPTKQEVEKDRAYLIDRLVQYAGRAGMSFFVAHPDNVRIVNGSFHDIWICEVQDDGSTAIQVPRHVVAVRPKVGEAIQFRPEVPAFLIVGSMAHELAHGDRASRDLRRHMSIFEGFQASNRHKLDLSCVRLEEMATDVEAYGILQAEGIPLTPNDYIATVPQPSDYRRELASLIGKQ